MDMDRGTTVYTLAVTPSSPLTVAELPQLKGKIEDGLTFERVNIDFLCRVYSKADGALQMQFIGMELPTHQTRDIDNTPATIENLFDFEVTKDGLIVTPSIEKDTRCTDYAEITPIRVNLLYRESWTEAKLVPLAGAIPFETLAMLLQDKELGWKAKEHLFAKGYANDEDIALGDEQPIHYVSLSGSDAESELLDALDTAMMGGASFIEEPVLEYETESVLRPACTA